MIALFAKNQNFNKLSNQLNPPAKFLTQTLFQTQNPKDVRDASRTTKVRDLGKQRKRSLCSRKNQISTNYPNNLIPTKLFANSKFKRRTQRIQDPVTPSAKTFKIVLQMCTKVIQALFK